MPWWLRACLRAVHHPNRALKTPKTRGWPLAWRLLERGAPRTPPNLPEIDRDTPTYRYLTSPIILLSGQNAAQGVFNSFRITRGERPGTRLAEDVQVSFFLQHVVIACSIRFAEETNVYGSRADVQIFKGDLRQPFRKVGVKQQGVKRGVGIKSEHRL